MESEAYVYLRSSAPTVTSADKLTDTRDTGAALLSQDSLLSELDKSCVEQIINLQVATTEEPSSSKGEIREVIGRLKTLQNDCEQYRKKERLRVIKHYEKQGRQMAKALKNTDEIRKMKSSSSFDEKLDLQRSSHTNPSRTLDYQSLWSETFGKPS